MNQSQTLASLAEDTGAAPALQTQTTQNRRKYPREPQGVKNEWHALIQHQAEVNNQIAQFEKDLKYLKSQELGQAYDQRLQEKIQAKERKLTEKQREEKLMTAQINEHQQALAMKKQEKQALQSHLAGSYDNLIQHHAILKNEEKQRKLEMEIRQLEENRRKMNSEQRRKLRAKIEFSNTAQDQISDFYNKKNLERQSHLRFKDEYRQQMQQNIQRDTLKEENYRNHFQATADQQKYLEELHVQNVLSDYQQRQQKIMRTIENQVAESEKRAFEKEMQQRLNREDAKNDLRTILQYQIEHKSGLRESAKQFKMREVEESVKKSQDYQQFLQDTKAQKQLLQQNYKGILDKQQQEYEENQKMNRMTKHEKKLNLMDLQAYKNSEHKLHSLVNGIQHSRYDFTGSPVHKKIAKSTLLSYSNTNLNDVSRQSSQIKQRHYTSMDYGAYGSETLGNSREQLNASINNLPHSVSATPKKPELQGSLNKSFASPTYQTSAGSILSNQLSSQYINQSPINSLSGQKTLPDPVNEDLFYRPSRHIPFSKLLNEQFPKPEQDKSSASLLIGANTSFHNPILNPLPFNNQNPYLIKEFKPYVRSSSEKRLPISYFARQNLSFVQA